MRQLGTLSNEREARQFAAWLVSQRIESHAEEESGRWVVWVRDEDKLPESRAAFAHFLKSPSDPKYQDAEQTAQAILRDEEARRRQAQGNVVEMRNRWGSNMPGMGGVKRRAPLVMLLIAASALVALLTSDNTMSGRNAQPPYGAVYRKLLFVDPQADHDSTGRYDIWAGIRQLELWRLVTPIFIHYGLLHIVLNMFWLYSFGSIVEERRGGRFLLLLVIALAVASNIGQAVEISIRAPEDHFGGMSGVGYGLFGYIFIKARYDSRERYFLSPGTTFMAMLWFTLCILREIPPFDNLLAGAIDDIANSAHAVGLLAGAAIAYAPLLVRKPA